MNIRFGLSQNKELETNNNEKRHWLSDYPKSLKIYNEALDKYSKGIFLRNVLDDIKLSLELLLNIY